MREYDLGDILSVSHGRMFSSRGLDGVRDLIEYLVDEPVFTHQLPRVANECAPSLREQLPFLDQIKIPRLNSQEQYQTWMARQYQIHGRMHPVRPVPPGVHEHVHPVLEAIRMFGLDDRQAH